MKGNYAVEAKVEENAMSALDEIRIAIAEVERLQAAFGLQPARIEVGQKFWESLKAIRQGYESAVTEMQEGYSVLVGTMLPESSLRGLQVMLAPTLAPDEWSVVYKARKL